MNPFSPPELSLLRDAIQPRYDWFGIEVFQHDLLSAIQTLNAIDHHVWPTDVVKSIITKVNEDPGVIKTLYQHTEPKGSKGIYGSHPIQAALWQIAKHGHDVTRLTLLAHIIHLALLWRNRLDHSVSPDDMESERRRNEYAGNLERACLAVRKLSGRVLEHIDLDEVPSWKIRQQLSQLLAEKSHIYDRHSIDYIGNLERFVSYALAMRNPRNTTHGDRTAEARLDALVTIEHIDDDPSAHVTPDAVREFASLYLLDAEGRDRFADVRSLGIAQSEEAAHLRLQQERHPLRRRQGDSAYLSVIRARSAAAHRQKAAQLLPHRWDQLNEFDIRMLWKAAERHRDSEVLSSIIALVLMTGRCLESVLQLKLVRDASQLPGTIESNALYLCQGDSAWVSAVLTPEQRRQFQPQWAPHMLPTVDQLTLPIPPALLPPLQKRLKNAARRAKHRSVGLFNKDQQRKITDALMTLLSKTNKTHGTRLTLHRLKNHLFNTLNHSGQDIADACLITGLLPPFGQQASLYYYAPSRDSLAAAYQQAMDRISRQAGIALPSQVPLTATTTSPEHIGSQLVPTDSYVSQMVSTIKSTLKGNRHEWAGERMIQQHNAYTAYTAMMLMFATGYRGVRDPLSTITEINARRGWIIISDKIDDSSSHSRIVPIIGIASTQLRHYAAHAEFMRRRLSAYLDAHWESTFFFLDQRMQPTQVSPRALARHLQLVDAPPLNINRHYLRTRLRDLNVSGECVDAVMGHWDHGQEPMSKFSSFSPTIYRNRVAFALDRLMSDVGWEAIEGLA